MKPINGSGMKRAILINDLSCFGKCSLSVALPIVSYYGIEAVCLPTAILSTHTGGFENYAVVDMTDNMMRFAEHWESMNMKVDCIYTGFFSSLRQISFAENFIKKFSDENTLIIVDPVLGDNGKMYPCFTEDFAEEMRRLAGLANVIVPNKTEAAILSGMDPETPAEELLSKLKNTNVVITGIRDGENIGYRARFGNHTVKFEKPYINMQLHGTGDVFASAFCGELMSGTDIDCALENAAEFCNECVIETAKRQPAHWYGLAFEDVLKRR